MPYQLTHGARESADDESVTNGLANFIAMEEIGRMEGYWAAPRPRPAAHAEASSAGSVWRLAFEQVHSAHVPQFRIMHQGSAAVGAAAQEDHRYPFAGEPNPSSRLGVARPQSNACPPSKSHPTSIFPRLAFSHSRVRDGLFLFGLFGTGRLTKPSV